MRGQPECIARMANILFVHRQGPGQFVHLAKHLAQQGHEVAILSESHDQRLDGVLHLDHEPAGPNAAGQTAVDYQVRLGTRAAEAMERLRRRRDAPDVIFGHAGWGSLLFTREVFPATPVLAYCEHYYRTKGADIGFDPSDKVGRDDVARMKRLNFAQTTTLLDASAGISPTNWQRNGYPDLLRQQIAVAHEGVDIGFCRPDEMARYTLPDGRSLKPGDPVITFAARHLEPYRGFPQFMRAAASVAQRHPEAIFVVAGADGAAYGTEPGNGQSWREVMMAETGIDPSRMHFVGTLPHRSLISLFQVSAGHVYLSYPFVLSWSMLEAMASGVLLIGSDTPPVREFLSDGRNGMAVPFFDTEALASAMSEALRARPGSETLRKTARQTVVDRVSLTDCLQRQTDLIFQYVGTPKIWA